MLTMYRLYFIMRWKIIFISLEAIRKERKMQYNFDENRFLQKIDTIQPNKEYCNKWNSFSNAPTVGEGNLRTGVLYGTLNPKLDAMELRL